MASADGTLSCFRMDLNKNSAVLLLCLSFLTGCGSPGVPLPPSLELARPVNDLHAVRKGDRISLTWTAPSLTTDGHNITHRGETAICRSLATPIKACSAPVGKIKTERASAGNARARMTYTDQVPPDLQAQNPTADAYFAVNVLNSYGRSAGLSNQVSVPAAPTLPPPADFKSQLTAEGVQLSWAPIAPQAPIEHLRNAIRIYRREQGQTADAVAGEVPVAGSAAEFSDKTFEWEKTYTYRATVVTYIAQPDGSEHQVEGDDTPSVSIFAHDVFPPATPIGLQAVFSGPGQKPFIDLIWTPNTESDLAGYNVYRRERDIEPVKINAELVKSPAWRDSDIAPGHEYSYSVTAVDVRGNESPRSEQAAETAPAQ